MLMDASCSETRYLRAGFSDSDDMSFWCFFSWTLSNITQFWIICHSGLTPSNLSNNPLVWKTCSPPYLFLDLVYAFSTSASVRANRRLLLYAVVAFSNISAGDRDETELTFRALRVKISALFFKEKLEKKIPGSPLPKTRFRIVISVWLT